MKTTYLAFASLSLLLLRAPSANADNVYNLEIHPIENKGYQFAQYSCPYNHVHRGDCASWGLDGFRQIQSALTKNLELIQAENTRIDTGIVNTSANTSSITSNDTDIAANTSSITSNDTDIASLQSLVKSSGSEVQIGSDSNGVTISSTSVKVGGENVIRRASDGSVHIGKNSLVLKESGGRQQMWATDASGDSIDIDVTNGSRLLINGRDVEKSIDNVGALSAALSSVPAVSADSQFTCGFGGGTHSSAYALSAGCASRVSDRVSINAALATVVNNQTGDSDDNLSARAGFTFRLGKIDDSPKVAARKAAALHDEVAALRDENALIKAASIEQKQLNFALMARLERLEAIALGQSPAITKVSLK